MCGPQYDDFIGGDAALGGDPVARSVLEAVAAVMAESEPVGELTPDLELRSDLGFDSVMLMRLKFTLEQRFPAAGPLTLREMLGYLVTPRAVAEFLRQRLSASAGTRAATPG
ncbi:MAG TPA: acyl carrier protein [Actinospica sp.]|nr:acyl carrier protein [Actinospica sp.]